MHPSVWNPHQWTGTGIHPTCRDPSCKKTQMGRDFQTAMSNITKVYNITIMYTTKRHWQPSQKNVHQKIPHAQWRTPQLQVMQRPLPAKNPPLAMQVQGSTTIYQWSGAEDCPTLANTPMPTTAPAAAREVDGTMTCTPTGRARQSPQQPQRQASKNQWQQSK